MKVSQEFMHGNVWKKMEHKVCLFLEHGEKLQVCSFCIKLELFIALQMLNLFFGFNSSS